MKVKLGNSEYSIKFGFKPTLKSHLIKDVSESVNEQDGSLESVEKLLLETLPKMLLVGLQISHKDEFGYDYDTNEKYDEQFNKVLNLLSEKIDDGEIDCIELFNELENELESNSFLAKMMETEKKNRTPAKKNSIQDSQQELTWEYYVAEIRPFYLMVTKGYGFSVDDIDMMNPELLNPYVDAYKEEWKQRDMEMYMWFGRYATSALVTAIDATFGKGNSKYVKETCYDSIEKHNTDDPDAEIREMLKAEEAWAAESRKSHLPKPKIV